MTGFAGFDVSSYPGDTVVDWLKANTNLKWCGFYLAKAPSHSDTGWMAKRARLVAGGWGIAPIYVGQQTIPPGSRNSSGPQGKIDGADAAFLATRAGFPAGSCLFLDLENGKPFTAAQKAYVAAWCAEVSSHHFAPGVYCSHTFAADVHLAAPAARIWVFKVSTTAAHPVPGPHYPDNHPAASGYVGAFAWQLGQNCQITVPPAPGGKLTVDLDTASWADPGAPGTP
jgi:hypothetical protein